MESTAEIIGFVAGLFGTVSFLPQIVKTWQTKSAQDLSMVMLVISLVTYILYVIYGLMLSLLPITVMVGISALLTVTLIYQKIRYTSNE